MGGRKKRKKDGKREGGAKGREKRKGWREETRKEESKEARMDFPLMPSDCRPRQSTGSFPIPGL